MRKLVVTEAVQIKDTDLKGSTHSEADPEILEGTISRFLFRSDDDHFAVGLLRTDEHTELVRIAGELGNMSEGDPVRLMGRFRVDPRFGHQFKVSAAQPLLPHTEAGLIAYLSSGRIQSVGPKLAQRMVSYFGQDTLSIITKSPERLCEVEGIGPKRCTEITQQIQDQIFQRDALIFLQGLDIGPALASRIWNCYAEKTLSLVRENPYRLAGEVDGIGFKTADRIAQSLGFDPKSPIRAAAAIIHMLGRAHDDGHVFLPRTELVRRLVKLIGEDAPIEREIDALISESHLVDDNGLYLKTSFEYEVELCERLETRVSKKVDALSVDLAGLERRTALNLATAQRDAVKMAMAEGLMVLTGGPGTGKTTTVRAIQRVFSAAGLDTLLAAPTGRASRRLAEATESSASTVHRLLGFHPVEGFRYNEEELLEADAIIIDEVSMLDQALALALFRAIPPHTRVVLVGDADQLPSVGAGNVLADILTSKRVPTVRLTEVFRQVGGSEIVENAYRILEGHTPQSGTEANNSDFFIVPADTPERAAQLIETIISERIPRRFGLHPVKDVQVLTPMHRGVCGAHQLNERLQTLLNPDGGTLKRGNRTFRVGDKIMQLKNDYQKEVFNGDVGQIMAQTAEGVALRFDQRILNYDREGMDKISLAYACSVHKSQGSEYPAVVVPILTEHWLMLQRNLLYTAITRGKQLVVLVGQSKAIARATRNTDGLERFTQLANRLGTL
jgi:exodeoxyribonuclease V alpha subunit